MSAFRGRNKKKGKLAKFLDMLEKGLLAPHPVLVLEDFDRISREQVDDARELVRRILLAGCDIFCTLTWRLYTKASLNEPMALLEMVWRFYLSHEESAKKAKRSRENWATKHKEAGGKIMSKNRPWWLGIDGEGIDRRFVPLPEKVAIVRQMFAWCIQGWGMRTITIALNKAKVKSARTQWGEKVVHQCLTDGRVLGNLPICEYGDARKPKGALTGYYPAVIDQKTFDAAQASIQSRKGKSGRPSGFVNLFTGLVHYPEHDCNMVFLNKSYTKRNRKEGVKKIQHRYLASYLGHKGVKPSVLIPYDCFESAMLKWLYEATPEDFEHEQRGDELQVLKDELKVLEQRMKTTAAQLSKLDTDIPALVKAVTDMDSRKKVLNAEIAKHNQRATRPHLKRTQSLAQMLASKRGEELKQLREEVRQHFRLLVDRIDVEIKDGRAYCVIYLSSGKTRQVWFSLTDPTEVGLFTDDKGSIPVADLDRLF
jgi:hypothetical protein